MDSVNLDSFYVGYLESQRIFENVLQDFLFLIPLLLFFGLNFRQLKKWWKKNRHQNRKEQEHFKSLAKKSKITDDTEERRQARRELIKTVRKNIVVMSISILAVLIAWFALDDLTNKIQLDRINFTRETLSVWDSHLELLNRKATPLEKSLESLLPKDHTIIITKEVDMRHQVHRAEEEMRNFAKKFRDELLCSKKFEEYVVEKRYQGYDEVHVLHGAIDQYDVCMLENGWFTEACSKTDDEKDCNELVYRETTCAEKLRQWIGADKSKWSLPPCPGYTWNWKNWWDRLPR